MSDDSSDEESPVCGIGCDGMAGCDILGVGILRGRVGVDCEVVLMGLTTFSPTVLVSGFLVFLLVSLDPESLGLSTIPCFVCFLTEESFFEFTWVSSDASVVRLIEPEASSLYVRVFLLDPDRGLFKVV